VSTDDLRRELDRISGSAPDVHLARDTWERARRSVVRERVAVAAAGFAVVAIVAAGVTWLPDRLDPPVADSTALGVPDRLYSVPDRMSDRDSDDGRWLRDEVEDDVTGIEVGAAAWLTHWGLPVVVDASDGDYHLLDLPDFDGNNERVADLAFGDPVVALSPDGRQLAYSYAVFGPDSDTGPIPSGVRVIDLQTGKLREIPVEGAAGTAVNQIEWSPNGSWLAFAGWQPYTWTSEWMGTASGATVSDSTIVGRVAPGATQAETRPSISDDGGLAVDDQGTVTWSDGRVHVWDQDGVTPGPEDDDQGLERALGTTSDGLAVRLDADRGGVDLVSADGTATRVVVIEDVLTSSSLSLATDLMSSDRPTVERPEPDWPWSEARWQVTIFLGIAGMIALMGLSSLWRRYAPRASPRNAS